MQSDGRYVAQFFRMLFLLSQIVCFSQGCFHLKDSGYECGKNEPETHYYFDKYTGLCQPFWFNGCGGNENNFEKLSECINKCEKNSGSNATLAGSKDVDELAVTYETACNHTFSFIKSTEPEGCKKNSACPTSSFVCVDGYCCPSKEYICSQDLDVGHELREKLYKHTTRFAYNKAHKSCTLFTFFGHGGNFNNFPDFPSCMKFCSP